MAVLPIIYAPNSVFKQEAKPIDRIDDEIKQLAKDMLETMYFEKAVGLGSNMVGIDRQIIVVDLRENSTNNPYVMLNPEIIESSQELVEYEEASISFPGISAVIQRPKNIKVKYLDLEGEARVLEVDGFFARVIQHEMDYLCGKVYLDYLSKLKRDLLLKKMQKFIKHHPPHIHGAHCSH
ncbi:MAG: peptide deformylase [Rickettsiales bacterium]